MHRIKLIHRALKYRFRHDPAEIRSLLSHTPRGGVALDIGAHKGAYTWWLARAVGKNGRTIALEPQEELAKRLDSLFASNDRVSIVNGALFTETGTATLSVLGQGVSHGATLRKPERIVPEMRSTEVATVSMSDLVDKNNLSRLDFIKIDAEGMEREILNASADVLARFRPTVLVECELRHGAGSQDPVGELWNIFKPLGYQCQCFYNGKLIDIDSFNYQTHQSDVADKAHYGNNFLLTHPDGPRTG